MSQPVTTTTTAMPRATRETMTEGTSRRAVSASGTTSHSHRLLSAMNGMSSSAYQA